MNYEWSKSEIKVRTEVREWLESDECPGPSVLESREPSIVRAGLYRARAALKDLGARIDGQGEWSWFASDFEVARASSSLFLGLCADRLFHALVAGFGGTSGDEIGAVAFSDPGDDQAPARLERHGDGYVLNGIKPFVTNGPIADIVAVFAMFDGVEAVCLVDRGVDGARFGSRMDLMGLDGLAVGRLELDGARMDVDRILGPFPGGEAGAWYLRRRDLCLADACAGLMHRTLKDAAAFAGDRKRDGRPIIANQEVGFKLAEMLTLTQTCELLNQRARWMLDSGNHEAGTLVGCARVFAAENAEKVASMAMQVTGGSGYARGGVSERAFGDAKGLALAGTSVEKSRMAIADELLERY